MTHVYTRTHTHIYVCIPVLVARRTADARDSGSCDGIGGEMQEPCSTIIRLYKRCKVDNCKVADRAVQFRETGELLMELSPASLAK